MAEGAAAGLEGLTLAEQEGTVEEQRGHGVGPRLPMELVFRILDLFLACSEDPEYRAIPCGASSAMFRWLRLVSTSIRDELLSHHPVNVANLARSIVRFYLRKRVRGSASVVLAATLRCSDVVARAARLYIAQVTPTIASLLPEVLECPGAMITLSLELAKLGEEEMFPLASIKLAGARLHKLLINGTYARTDFAGFDLSHLVSLRELECIGHHRYPEAPFAAPPRFAPPGHTKLVLRRLNLGGAAVGRLRVWEMEHLEELDLSDSLVEAAGARSLGLPRLRHLRRLSLWNGGIGDDGVATLGVDDSVSLVEVVLGGNLIIRPFDLGTVVKLHLGGANSLSSLDFALETNASLQELDLHGAGFLNREKLGQLARQLCRNQTLRTLSLWQCQLTDDMLSDFQLDGTQGLVHLELDHNLFSDVGLRGIGLERSNTIKEVGLMANNGVSAAYMKTLVRRYGFCRDWSEAAFDVNWLQLRAEFTTHEKGIEDQG